ncbi:hypothetical protein SK128_002350 [Halocaridina rubra]|uniref:Uncharacterized protein n=1 Tax=Halocaridina rubra TaxID=373956 RepID=A0AAN8WM08_HALRR
MPPDATTKLKPPLPQEELIFWFEFWPTWLSRIKMYDFKVKQKMYIKNNRRGKPTFLRYFLLSGETMSLMKIIVMTIFECLHPLQGKFYVTALRIPNTLQ